MPTAQRVHSVLVPPLNLAGDLRAPDHPAGIVIFAHGSGSSRFSPRNQQVAQALGEAGFATLLLDLLTDEEAEDRARVFDIDLLAERVTQAIDWVRDEPGLAGLPIGLFGASTGAAAALKAASLRPQTVATVVSRGGRPDLAGAALPLVTAPTLLIVGEEDEPVLTWNREALTQLGGFGQLDVVPGATHLFEEPGALETVIRAAVAWFLARLPSASRGASAAG